MKKLIIKLLNDEKIKYLIAGGCTTMVNLVAFFLLRTFTAIDRNVCNVIAIILAIIFAYVVNKLYVFKHHTGSIIELLREMFSFAGARILSMIVEVLGFALLCDSFRISEILSKIVVQFVVVVINYVFSKLFVFKERDEKIVEKISRNWSWLLGMAITLFTLLCVMIIGKVAPFGDNSFTIVDSIHQYLPFFSDYQDKLVNEGSLFYTFDVGGGGSFQSLLLYYMASPLNLIIILFKRSSLHAAMSLLIAFKMVLAAGTFGYFLSRRKGRVRNNFFIPAFSVAYALSNYMVGYSWNIMWLDCIFILPLIILGFERIMDKESPKLYILSLFYCLYCNYYIAFIVCIFLVLWFLATGHKNVKKFFTDGLKFAGFSILSAGMAAFSLITAYLAIMTTASASAGFPKSEWYGNIIYILKQHIFLTEPITNQTFDGGANLYCGVFAVLLLFIYLFSGRIKPAEKIRKSLLLVFFILSFNNTLLNFVWHGFHDQYGIPNRFAFVYIFTLLVIGYDALIRIKGMDAAYILSSMFIALAFIFACKYKTNISETINDWTLVIISALLIIGYSVLLALRATGKIKPLISAGIISLIFVAEIIVNASFGYGSNGFASGDYYMSRVDTMKANKQFVDDYADAKDYGLYREDIINPIMLDEATLCNMKSLGTFCSTVRGDMVNTMGNLGFYTGANEYLYYGATPVTNTMLGVRFIYATADDYYPSADTEELLVNRNGYYIYENKYCLPFAYGVDKNILDWDVSEGNGADCQNNFMSKACGTDYIFTSVEVPMTTQGTNCTADPMDSPGLIGYIADTTSGVSIMSSFSVPEDGNYYVEIRGNYIEKIRVYINGEQVAYDRYQLQTLNLGNLEADDSVSLETVFSNGCSESGSINLYLSKLNVDRLKTAYTVLSENAMNVTEFEDGYIAGTVDLTKAMVLFTSIPYDEGWTIYVDGEKAEKLKLGDAFMGVSLDAGKHDIVMKYFPYGLKYGIVISIIAWVIFFVIITKKKVKIEPNVQ